MREDKYKKLLTQVHSGEIDVETAYKELKNLPYHDLGYAKVDHHRKVRQSVGEIIFCKGKTIDQILGIIRAMAKDHENIIATRADLKVFLAVKKEFKSCRFYREAKVIVVNPISQMKKVGFIVVATGGTADIPIAEEASVIAELLGNNVERVYDVGVAGIHRVLYQKEIFDRANVIIAVAGMEGALPSVIGGLVDVPVIAVPTSIGYGASFNGIAALLGMLNSCASGVSVVNIDNGFGAAFQANLINKKCKEPE
ncbi:nickel pincer cofactor biosynthesis protein LarB [bacterium]|nr:nickel pincer cofactor biosynthesis protein LarB [bacterium]